MRILTAHKLVLQVDHQSLHCIKPWLGGILRCEQTLGTTSLQKFCQHCRLCYEASQVVLWLDAKEESSP